MVMAVPLGIEPRSSHRQWEILAVERWDRIAEGHTAFTVREAVAKHLRYLRRPPVMWWTLGGSNSRDRIEGPVS